MSHTITVRLNKELSAWLEETANRTGTTKGEIIRQRLEEAKASAGSRSFMRLAGAVRGPRNLSRRKGFSKT